MGAAGQGMQSWISALQAERSSSESSLLQLQRDKGAQPRAEGFALTPRGTRNPKPGSVLPGVTIRGILSPVPGGSDISGGKRGV